MRPVGSCLALALCLPCPRRPHPLVFLLLSRRVSAEQAEGAGSELGIVPLRPPRGGQALRWALVPPPPATPWQMETSKGTVAKLSDVLPKVSDTSSLASLPKEASSQISMVSMTSSARTPVLAVPGEPSSATLEFKARWLLSQAHVHKTKRTLSEALLPFTLLPDIRLRSSAPAVLLGQPPPLEQTHWSQSKVLDLGPIDALNFFCQQHRTQQGSPQEEAARHSPSLAAPELDAVVPQPRDRP